MFRFYCLRVEKRNETRILSFPEHRVLATSFHLDVKVQWEPNGEPAV